MIRNLKKLLQAKVKTARKKEIEHAKESAGLLAKLMEPRLDCEIKKILDADGMEGLEAVYNSAADETVIYFDILVADHISRDVFEKDRTMMKCLYKKLSRMYDIDVTIIRNRDDISLRFRTDYRGQ